MKNQISYFSRKIILAILLFFIPFFTVLSQPTYPPNPGGPPSGPPLPYNNSSAPIDGGSGILVLLSLFYAAGKVCFVLKKKKFQE